MDIVQVVDGSPHDPAFGRNTRLPSVRRLNEMVYELVTTKVLT